MREKKKKTALIPAVGATGEQPFKKQSTGSITEFAILYNILFLLSYISFLSVKERKGSDEHSYIQAIN